MTPSHRARAHLDDPRTVILDTETTGLGSDAEIVEIAILTPQGDVLLDTLVQPTRPIPPEASLIHGIEDDHVETAPTFRDLWPQLRAILADKLILAYNVDYDLRLLLQSLTASDIQDPFICDFDCVMILTQEHLARRRWCNLATAAFVLGCDKQDPTHRALGDAKTALAVLKAIAGVTEQEGQPA